MSSESGRYATVSSTVRRTKPGRTQGYKGTSDSPASSTGRGGEGKEEGGGDEERVHSSLLGKLNSASPPQDHALASNSSLPSVTSTVSLPSDSVDGSPHHPFFTTSCRRSHSPIVPSQTDPIPVYASVNKSKKREKRRSSSLLANGSRRATKTKGVDHEGVFDDFSESGEPYFSPHRPPAPPQQHSKQNRLQSHSKPRSASAMFDVPVYTLSNALDPLTGDCGYVFTRTTPDGNQQQFIATPVRITPIDDKSMGVPRSHSTRTHSHGRVHPASPASDRWGGGRSQSPSGSRSHSHSASQQIVQQLITASQSSSSPNRSVTDERGSLSNSPTPSNPMPPQSTGYKSTAMQTTAEILQQIAAGSLQGVDNLDSSVRHSLVQPVRKAASSPGLHKSGHSSGRSTPTKMTAEILQHIAKGSLQTDGTEDQIGEERPQTPTSVPPSPLGSSRGNTLHPSPIQIAADKLQQLASNALLGVAADTQPHPASTSTHPHSSSIGTHPHSGSISIQPHSEASAAWAQNRNLAEQLIEQQGSLPVRSLKSFLIGPPRVGKTTARRRLTKEITNISHDEIVPSTGIEAPLTVQLYHPTEQSSVLLSTGWHCLGLEELCSSICGRVLNSSADSTTPSSSGSTSSQPRQSSPQSTIAAHSSTSRSTSLVEQGYLTQSTKDAVITTLTALVAKQDWEPIRERLKNLEELTFLQIIDVGGQPEFHEILPLLLHGLALNLIFLNVMQNLDSPYRVVYRGISGPSQISYNSEFTTREIIQRVLHTISSLQTIGRHKPTAILIGTHLDLAKQGEALDMDKAIQESLKDDYFMKNDILYAVNKPGEETRYIHPLDNVSEDSTDIEELRELIIRIVYQSERFPVEDIPTGALLLLMILRKKFDPHPGWCSKEDCVKIAECLGISREALLGKNGDGVLDDLQNRFGAILFYGDVEGLRDRVIVNANIIMGPPSELFVHAFGTTESEPQTAERIRASGEISHDLMNRVCSNSKKEVSDNSIPTEEIVGLLEARYILYKDARSAANKDPVYFLPSVLSPDSNVVKESSDPRHLADLPYSSLLFLPSSGFVPLGFFSATAVKLSNKWILDELHRFRNRIRFYFQPKKGKMLHVELRMLSTHLEFRVVSQESNPIIHRLMIKCRQQLSNFLSEVTAAFPHMKQIRWYYGFYCPHALQSGGRPHVARCLTTDEPHDVVCSQKDCRGGPVALDIKHKCWFMECEAKEEGNIAAAAGHTFGNNTPTLLKLRTMKGRDGSDLKVVETIADGDYEFFGMLLLLDENEVAICLLKKKHIHEGPESITKAILKKWLTDPSPTAPCTYQHLIECLRQSHLGALADSIEAVVGEKSHLATS